MYNYCKLFTIYRDITNKVQSLEVENLQLQNDIDSVVTVVEKNKRNYYLLYGFCSQGNNMYLYHYIIMDKFKHYTSLHFPNWIILNISIESFLTSVNYTHESLMNFTKLNAPFINIKKDKFQWVFEPSCERHYLHFNIKEYYDKNRLSLNTITIPMPMNVQKYLDNSNVIDDDEREIHSHITNINYHKYYNNQSKKEYILNIKNNIRLSNIWQNNTYFSSTIKYLQSLSNNRPLLFAMSGEVFDNWIIRRKENVNCQSKDIHIQRTKSWPRKGCVITAYIQGILQQDLKNKRGTTNMNFNNLIINDNHINNDVNSIIQSKNRFCSFTVKTFLIYEKYHIDALVRHTFNSMLSSQYKHCDMLGYHHDNKTNINYLCDRKTNPKYKDYPLSKYLVIECQKNYKFSINMENTNTYGYTSEKIYTGLLANTIPIYFGNNDIKQIINLDRIIHCHIDDNIIVQLRTLFVKKLNQFKQQLGINKHMILKYNQTARYLLQPLIKKWGIKSYGPYLQSCINKVINVDSNLTLYKYKLSQPILPNNSFENSHYDGTIISKSIIDIMKFLQSPLFA